MVTLPGNRIVDLDEKIDGQLVEILTKLIYLVSITLCHICHGPELTGEPPVGAGKPPGPDLMALGAPGGWSAEQFVSTIRTGVTPDGNKLNPDFMPSDKYTNLTDQELVVIWRYVQSLASE